MDEKNENVFEGEPTPEAKKDAQKIVAQIKELVKKGNVARVVVLHKDEPLLNLPLNAGLLGTVIGAYAAPWAMVATVIATIGFACRVQVIKTDGEVVEILHEDTGKKAQAIGAEMIRDVKDTFKK